MWKRRCFGLRSTLPAMLLVLAAACTDTISNTCPQLVVYSADEQDRAADELEKLGPTSELAHMMVGYKQLRDQVRACRAAAQ